MEAKKNQILCGKVEGLGSNGEGIIRHGEATFFVPYCLEGENVRFRVLKTKGNVGFGKVEEILEPSSDRVEPRCATFSRCGGCLLQHLSYAKQLEFKTKLVKDSLKKIGGIETNVEPIVPSAKQYEYRNKLQLPIGTDANGNTVIGFYAERSHRIVETGECSIHPSWSKLVISAVKKYIEESGARGYDEKKKTGELRHVVVRELNGKFIVTIVSTTEKLPNKKALIKAMGTAFPEFTLWLNVNKQETNFVFGKDFFLLYGDGFFQAEEGGIVYEAGPQTFVQVNSDVRGELYDYVLQTIAVDGDEVVVDAYSGGGLLTAMLAKRVKRVYGIEIVREAVDCADALKKRNSLSNMVNICGAVEDKLFDVLAQEKGEKVRLVLDPPRAGIARSVLHALIRSDIPRITLVSCNPATLARDLGLLTGTLKEENGELKKGDGKGTYEIESVKPWDMFPQTKHVETLVVLSHKKPDGHIGVTMEFGEEEG